MKKLFTLILITLLISCAVEDDVKIKNGVREYLKETLHNPNSLEEIDWNINREWKFKLKDSADTNSPMILDVESMSQKNDSISEMKFVRLTYRAENGYGALRKSETYAIYFEQTDILQFEEAAYSIKNKILLDIQADNLVNPRRLFLRNQFFLRNQGEATSKDFYLKYPEFN
ncbi:hypothetical protein [Christiangramia forsetii]|uniref:Secreted protein n=2 Tax=Christiangramia forsetii TaxID=411153 RepID=A0M4A6_CHRFK|nr:hypothetical protein [Christiangramia forsetii]GGG23862.1 hypothetical protein GCM10011532_03830 [Christiangramia forsetii]CAL67451.1 secreted protein [Christiangramia forsetii KT0803]